MKLIFNSAKQLITVPEFALQNNLTVKDIYAMIDAGKIKSTKKGKRTMIVL